MLHEYVSYYYSLRDLKKPFFLSISIYTNIFWFIAQHSEIVILFQGITFLWKCSPWFSFIWWACVTLFLLQQIGKNYCLSSWNRYNCNWRFDFEYAFCVLFSSNYGWVLNFSLLMSNYVLLLFAFIVIFLRIDICHLIVNQKKSHTHAHVK